MNLPAFFRGFLVAAVLSLGSLFAQDIVTVPKHANGIYQPNEPISWEVSAKGDASAFSEMAYSIKQFGKKVLKEGKLDLSKGPVTLETSLAEPSTVLVEFNVKVAGKEIKHAAGAVAGPGEIKSALPRPDDFDAFWDGKIADLQKIPMNAVVEAADSGKADIDYYKVTLDNINGTKVRGQLAKPKKEGKFPALLLVQYAGVYALPKDNVIQRAARGFLVLNIMAHDLPFDETPEFYKTANETTHKGYVAFGKADRNESYFLRMYLGCYRASEYLTGRDDWNGQVFVVEGASQGGQQAIATAGLFPKVTAVLANVPAGADAGGPAHGRGLGFPYWAGWGAAPDEKAIEVGRYFDIANLASRITAPCLIGLGLIDTTCVPSSVLSAANQIPGTKEVIILVDGEHQPKNGSHQNYWSRQGQWTTAILAGKPVPPQ